MHIIYIYPRYSILYNLHDFARSLTFAGDFPRPLLPAKIGYVRPAGRALCAIRSRQTRVDVRRARSLLGDLGKASVSSRTIPSNLRRCLNAVSILIVITLGFACTARPSCTRSPRESCPRTHAIMQIFVMRMQRLQRRRRPGAVG